MVLFFQSKFPICFLYTIQSILNVRANQAKPCTLKYIYSTYFEEFCLGWKGLCIEPQRRFAGIIQKSRTCGVVNSAVSLNDDVNVDIRVGGVLGGKIGTLSKEVRAETLSKTYPEHQNTVKGFRL